MEEEYLMKKYQKWNNYKDDSDSDAEEIPKMPTQFDVEGDADIVVSNDLLLTPEQIEKYKKLDKNNSEIWQVVVRKLRVWSASSKGAEDGDEAIPCRPYCILVNNLYPLGQVFAKKICDPPEVYPDPLTILQLTCKAMADPPTTTPQHRPDKIVFPDKFYVGQLRKTFASIGIECTYLSESEGIDSYIKELSKHLIQNDLASVAEISERPGLCSGNGITKEIEKDFYAACAKYCQLEPWKRLAERQALQLDAKQEIRLDKKHQVNGGSVFVSVIGSETGSTEIHGLALFLTRADLERRVLPPGERLALMEEPRLRRCGFCDKKAPSNGELKKCTRCKRIFYCNPNCQRSHWKDHKISCVAPIDEQSAGMKEKNSQIQWGVKEMSILFGPQTSMPFDELDMIDKNQLDIAEIDGDKQYPSPMIFNHGEPTIPNASDLVWLTRGLLAMIEVLTKQPLFMHKSMIDLVSVDEDLEVSKVELNCNVFGFEDQLVIKNSTVLTMQDVVKIRQAIEAQKIQSTTPPPPAPTNGMANMSISDDVEQAQEAQEAKKAQEGQDSNCILM